MIFCCFQEIISAVYYLLVVDLSWNYSNNNKKNHSYLKKQLLKYTLLPAKLIQMTNVVLQNNINIIDTSYNQNVYPLVKLELMFTL